MPLLNDARSDDGAGDVDEGRVNSGGGRWTFGEKTASATGDVDLRQSQGRSRSSSSTRPMVLSATIIPPYPHQTRRDIYPEHEASPVQKRCFCYHVPCRFSVSLVLTVCGKTT